VYVFIKPEFFVDIEIGVTVLLFSQGVFVVFEERVQVVDSRVRTELVSSQVFFVDLFVLAHLAGILVVLLVILGFSQCTYFSVHCFYVSVFDVQRALTIHSRVAMSVHCAILSGFLVVQVVLIFVEVGVCGVFI